MKGKTLGEGNIALSRLEELEEGRLSTVCSISNTEYTAYDITNLEYLESNRLWGAIAATFHNKGKMEWNEAIESCNKEDFEIVALGIAYLHAPNYLSYNCLTINKREILSKIGDGDEKYVTSQAEILKRRIPVFKEQLDITSTSDVLSCMRIPIFIFFLFLLIQIVQAAAYYSILETSLESGAGAINSNIIFAVIFAGISLTMSALDNVNPIVSLTITRAYLNATCKESSRTALDKMNSRILRLMEIFNLFLLIFTSVNLVPVQTDPLDIILNCTALFTISQLDEQVCGIWKLQLTNVLVIDLEKQEGSSNRRQVRQISIIMCIGVISYIINALA
jgi:hypothetical protein